MPVMKAPKKARVDSSSAMESSSPGWAANHAHLMERKGLEWWRSSIPTADVVEQWTCLNMGFPDPEGRQVDVSQGASRARASPKSSSSIVTPLGPVYL